MGKKSININLLAPTQENYKDSLIKKLESIRKGWRVLKKFWNKLKGEKEMKSLLIALIMSLTMFSCSTALALPEGPGQQIEQEQTEKTGIFQSVKSWTAGGIVTIVFATVFGFMRKKGWTLKIKSLSQLLSKYSKKISVILDESADVFNSSSVFFDRVNDSIKDNGSVKQNSIKEALEAGKKVFIEMGDVTALIKAK